jgi:hypothetical protein
MLPPTMVNTPPSITDFVLGSAALVDLHTIYLDPTTHELHLHAEKDSSSGGLSVTITPNERLLVLDNVFDFQVSLGFDVDGDGDVRDASGGGGGGNEWLHDAPGETTASLASPLDRKLLRLGRFELVVGVPIEGMGAGSAVFSPSRGVSISLPQYAMRIVGARFGPRNNDSALGLP